MGRGRAPRNERRPGALVPGEARGPISHRTDSGITVALSAARGSGCAWTGLLQRGGCAGGQSPPWHRRPGARQLPKASRQGTHCPCVCGAVRLRVVGNLQQFKGLETPGHWCGLLGGPESLNHSKAPSNQWHLLPMKADLGAPRECARDWARQGWAGCLR